MPRETEITGWVHQNEPAALRSGRVTVGLLPQKPRWPLTLPHFPIITPHHPPSLVYSVAFQGSTMLSGTSGLLPEGPHVTGGRNYGSESGRDLDGEMRKQ